MKPWKLFLLVLVLVIAVSPAIAQEGYDPCMYDPSMCGYPSPEPTATPDYPDYGAYPDPYATTEPTTDPYGGYPDPYATETPTPAPAGAFPGHGSPFDASILGDIPGPTPSFAPPVIPAELPMAFPPGVDVRRVYSWADTPCNSTMSPTHENIEMMRQGGGALAYVCRQFSTGETRTFWTPCGQYPCPLSNSRPPLLLWEPPTWTEPAGATFTPMTALSALCVEIMLPVCNQIDNYYRPEESAYVIYNCTLLSWMTATEACAYSTHMSATHMMLSEAQSALVPRAINKTLSTIWAAVAATACQMQ